MALAYHCERRWTSASYRAGITTGATAVYAPKDWVDRPALSTVLLHTENSSPYGMCWVGGADVGGADAPETMLSIPPRNPSKPVTGLVAPSQAIVVTVETTAYLRLFACDFHSCPPGSTGWWTRESYKQPWPRWDSEPAV